MLASPEGFSATLNYLFNSTLPATQSLQKTFEIDVSSDLFLIPSREVQSIVKDVYRKDISVRLDAGFCSNPYHIRYVLNGL